VQLCEYLIQSQTYATLVEQVQCQRASYINVWVYKLPGSLVSNTTVSNRKWHERECLNW